MDIAFLIESVIKIVGLVFLAIMPMVAYTVWAERKVAAAIQDRVGPNRVGVPFTKIGLAGLGQPIADGLKFLLKEDLTPGHVNKLYYWLAPALTMVPALLTCAVLPFGSSLDLSFLNFLPFVNFDAANPIQMVVADLDVGPLWIFAIASLSVYGIVLAGWASNSKYSFIGGVRSSSQMISYEIALGLSIIPVLLFFGELNLGQIVRSQAEHGWLLLPFSFSSDQGFTDLTRLVFWIPAVIAFVIFTVSIFAETNRTPFDLPECETELVAGYHTEYSSMKFALFFLGEYAAMIIGSGLIVTLFLGGWSLPFGIDGLIVDKLTDGGNPPLWLGLIHIGVFFAKTIAFLLFFIWVRWTVPRFRYDQLMRLGWVFFFEIALANIIIAAAVLMFIK